MNLDALAAFITGAASVAGAAWSIRRVVAHCEVECELRLAAFKAGLRERRT